MRRLLALLSVALFCAGCLVLARAQEAVVGGGVYYKVATGGGGGGITFTATDAKSASPGFASSGNWTGVNFGTASADRIVIVGLLTSDTATMTATIGGVSATQAIYTAAPNASIFYANVTSGSTGTVAWSASTGLGAICAVVGQIHGQTGGGSATPNNTGVYDTNQAQPAGPLSTTVSTGGIAFLTGGGEGAGSLVSNPTFTWTGTTSGSGDEVTFASTGNTCQFGLAHNTASSNVTVSSSASLSFAALFVQYAAWAP